MNINTGDNDYKLKSKIHKNNTLILWIFTFSTYSSFFFFSLFIFKAYNDNIIENSWEINYKYNISANNNMNEIIWVDYFNKTNTVITKNLCYYKKYYEELYVKNFNEEINIYNNSICLLINGNLDLCLDCDINITDKNYLPSVFLTYSSSMLLITLICILIQINFFVLKINNKIVELFQNIFNKMNTKQNTFIFILFIYILILGSLGIYKEETCFKKEIIYQEPIKCFDIVSQQHYPCVNIAYIMHFRNTKYIKTGKIVKIGQENVIDDICYVNNYGQNSLKNNHLAEILILLFIIFIIIFKVFKFFYKKKYYI